MHEVHGTFRRSLLGAAGLAAAAVLPKAASAAQPEESGGAQTAFTKWLDSIGGKYRQVIDMPEPNHGSGLLSSWVFLATAPVAYGVPERELGVVLVLRHASIPFALTDTAWRKYRLGEMFHLTDPASGAPATRNFFVDAKPGDLPVEQASLEKLIARGVKVGACDVALTVYSKQAAKRAGLPADQVKREWLAALVPGVHVVPSGVVALNGAQSRGCTYCFAG